MSKRVDRVRELVTALGKSMDSYDVGKLTDAELVGQVGEAIFDYLETNREGGK